MLGSSSRRRARLGLGSSRTLCIQYLTTDKVARRRPPRVDTLSTDDRLECLFYGVRVTQYAAVLWDLDGTIVDTEPLWMAAEHALAAEHGKIWTEEDGLALVGNSLIASGHYIREKLELEMTAEEIVDYLVEPARHVADRAHRLATRRS